MKLKALKEKRNDLLIKATALLDKAEEELRSLTVDEKTQYEDYYKEIEGLTDTIKKIEEQRSFSSEEQAKNPDEEEEIRSFERFCRGEERAFKVGENGEILPRTVVERIITATKEICPIMDLATVYNVKGDLIIPVYDETSSQMTAEYIDELAEGTEKSGDVKSIELKSYIVRVLTLVSNKLVNNLDFDIVSFVIDKVAKKLSEFIEKEALTGANGKMKGIFPNATQKVTATSSALKADDIIDLQLTVPTAVQANSVWIMHPSTFKQARKLKDTTGQYILVPDVVNGSGYVMLGKKVYLSANAPEFAASAKVMLYGDISGYVIKISNGMEIKVLKEKYADKYAVGVIGFTEVDGAIAEQSKLAVLEMGA